MFGKNRCGVDEVVLAEALPLLVATAVTAALLLLLFVALLFVLVLLFAGCIAFCVLAVRFVLGGESMGRLGTFALGDRGDTEDDDDDDEAEAAGELGDELLVGLAPLIDKNDIHDARY